MVNENSLDKYVFRPDNPSIQKLLPKNHLQIQNSRSDKQFRIFYLEGDIEKYGQTSRTYYFKNGAKIRPAVARP